MPFPWYNLTMDFCGWEKLSLVDFDDNLTTTLFMAGCPFRCPFCHNGDLVLRPNSVEPIPFSEIYDYLQKRRAMLDAVCITGGEPTLMPDLEEKLRLIKGLGYLVKLDSNGYNPEIVIRLIESKLVDYVAMDIKNSKAKYASTIGVSIDMSRIEKMVEYLQESKFPHEFRTTLVKEFHEENDIREMGLWLGKTDRFFFQRFIDNDHCIVKGLHEVPLEQALIFQQILRGMQINAELRGY